MMMGHDAENCAADLRLHVGAGDSGAGDGNRTRTISLEICPVTASQDAELGIRVTVDGPDCLSFTAVNGTLMARRSCLLAEPSQEFEVLHVAKDRVVGHEGNLEPDCGRGHPTIRLVRLVAQAMPGPDTPGTQRGIYLCQVRPRPDDFRSGYLVFEAPQPLRAPCGHPGAVRKFGNRYERDNRWPTFKEWPIARGE